MAVSSMTGKQGERTIKTSKLKLKHHSWTSFVMYHIVYYLGKCVEMYEIYCECILFRRDGVMGFPWLLKSQAANPTREHKNHICRLRTRARFRCYRISAREPT